MSYARFTNGSEVYVYSSAQGVTCCGCTLTGKETMFHAPSTSVIVAHIREHLAAGTIVPTTLIEDLEEDDAQNFGPKTYAAPHKKVHGRR